MANVIFGPIPYNEPKFAFLLESETLQVLELWDAYMESKTWKEFWERIGERGRSYFDFDEFATVTEEEAMEEGLTWFPVDDSTFDGAPLAESREWEWPPLAHIDGWYWLPRDIRWRYGMREGGFTAGLWVVFPPTEVTPVVAELRERGYRVEPNYELVAWTCGGESMYVTSALRTFAESHQKRSISAPQAGQESESLASPAVRDVSEMDLGTMLETLVKLGFDWGLGWKATASGEADGFGIEIHFSEQEVIVARESTIEATLALALSKALSSGVDSRNVQYRRSRKAEVRPEAVERLHGLVGEPLKSTYLHQGADGESLTWSEYFRVLHKCSEERGWRVYVTRSAVRPEKQEYACYINHVNGRHGTGWGTTLGGACVEGLVAMLQATPQEIPERGIY